MICFQHPCSRGVFVVPFVIGRVTTREHAWAVYCGPKIAPCVRLTHGSAQTNWPGDETAASQAAALATALFHTEIARKLANAGDTYKARVQCVWVPVVAPFCFSPALGNADGCSQARAVRHRRVARAGCRARGRRGERRCRQQWRRRCSRADRALTNRAGVHNMLCYVNNDLLARCECFHRRR